MGTTLTGTTPQDTYDSLIKVTDNSALSGTAKYLSDGLGNDSVLALSTARVGVGTSSPATTLDVAGTLRVSSATPTEEFYNTTNGDVWASIFSQASGTGSGASLVFSTKRDGNSATDKMTISQAGNVGIGTSAPLAKVDVRTTSTTNAVIGLFVNPSTANNTTKAASISLALADTAGDIKDTAFLRGFAGNANVTTGGLAIDVRKTDGVPVEVIRITPAGVLELAEGQIKFPATQVPSADPNTLDDYEEGTWTMGVSFGGASVGVTFANNTGTYTKIGRKVTVNGLLELSSKGSSTGTALLTGLPFAIGSGVSFFPAVSLGSIRNITFADMINAYGNQGATDITLGETTNAGAFTVLTNADFANNSEVIISLTYFV